MQTTHKYSLTEGQSGLWHYHISNGSNPTRGLCGARVMKTSMGLDQWKVPFGDHFTKKPTFCEFCDQNWMRIEDPRMLELFDSGPILLPKMVDGMIVGLHRYFATVGLIVGVTEFTMCERRYCFSEWHEALRAYNKFTDVDKHATGPWIKCKGHFMGKMIDALNPKFGTDS